MKITIEFETGNAAFEDDFPGEVRRILKMAALKLTKASALRDGSESLRDLNGNTVGSVTVTP